MGGHHTDEHGNTCFNCGSAALCCFFFVGFVVYLLLVLLRRVTLAGFVSPPGGIMFPAITSRVLLSTAAIFISLLPCEAVTQTAPPPSLLKPQLTAPLHRGRGRGLHEKGGRRAARRGCSGFTRQLGAGKLHHG